jgi:hypothetical protein
LQIFVPLIRPALSAFNPSSYTLNFLKMRKSYTALAFVLSLLLHFSAYSQTTLAAGDIMIIGWNANDNNVNSGGGYNDDDVDFLLLKNIEAGTTIYFTDLGWTGSGLQQNANNGCGAGSGAANDGCVKWTASDPMTKGTEVRVGVHYGLVASAGTVTGELISPASVLGGPGGNRPGYVSLATSSDEIIAFQGSMASPTLIAAVHYGSNYAGTLTTCQFSSTSTVNPGSSVGGFGFLRSLSAPAENAKYVGSVTSGTPAALRTAILDISNWSFTDGASVFAFPSSTSFTLPVQLTSFTGKSTTAGHLLEWKVATEDNFDRYEVETSTDGTNYRLVASVKAANRGTYSYTATPLPTAFQLYRLRLIDLDGHYKYSSIIRIENKSSKEQLVVFPNPAVEIARVSSKEAITSIAVSEVSGKKRIQENVNASNTVEIDLRALSPGIYLLTVNTRNGTFTKKIIKQ